MALCQRKKENIMKIPYRTKQVFKSIAIGILPVLVLALVAAVCWY